METLFCIIGKSGSGKTTIAEKLEEKGKRQIQSYTTRPKRFDNESGHIFISANDVARFKEALPNSNETIVAYDKYNGYEYFATLGQISECDIYVVNPKGAKMLNSSQNIEKTIITIYIKCGVVERFKRMRHRGDSISKAVKRIFYDHKDFVNCEDYCDYVFDNGHSVNVESVIDKIMQLQNL